jgi:hypothetical protein
VVLAPALISAAEAASLLEGTAKVAVTTIAMSESARTAFMARKETGAQSSTRQD